MQPLIGKVTINMLLGLGAYDNARGWGGARRPPRPPVGNGIPLASRSAVVAFFARMDIVVWWRGVGYGDDDCDGDDDDGDDDVISPAAKRAGVGRRNDESGGRNVLGQEVGGGRRGKRGGGGRCEASLSLLSMTTMTGGIFPRPPMPARRRQTPRCCLPLRRPTAETAGGNFIHPSFSLSFPPPPLFFSPLFLFFSLPSPPFFSPLFLLTATATCSQ